MMKNIKLKVEGQTEEDREFLIFNQDKNEFDDFIIIKRQTQSLKPFVLSLVFFFFSVSSCASSPSLSLQRIRNTKSHLLSIWPPFLAVIPPHIAQLPKHPWTIHSPHPAVLPSSPTLPNNTPADPDPHPRTERWDPVSVPQKDPSLWTCVGSAAVMFWRAHFPCFGFSHFHVRIQDFWRPEVSG